jgi:hypothetical protein
VSSLPNTDPVLQQLQAPPPWVRQLQERVQQLEATIQQQTQKPPEINLTITLPPVHVHVKPDIKPPTVNVSNDVHPAPVQVHQPSPPTVRVNVPTDGPKDIKFERDADGRINGATVTEKTNG